jgi:hypothetical protein
MHHDASMPQVCPLSPVRGRRTETCHTLHDKLLVRPGTVDSPMSPCVARCVAVPSEWPCWAPCILGSLPLPEFAQ